MPRTGKLAEYQSKRDFRSTPEPAGKRPLARKGAPRFTIQEHHATALHWDFRLEKEGVLVSWAVPRGLPRDPKRNNLAVHTEDHPMEYLTFHGEIPEGYGAGKVILWDIGTYEAEKFRENEVIVTLSGRRASGKYALFQTDGKNWLMHRMDPPADPDWQELPDRAEPMEPTPAKQVPSGKGWAFGLDYGGLRVIAATESGRMKLTNTTSGDDITAAFPEIRLLGEELGQTQALLDGTIIVTGADGRPDRAQLERREAARASATRRLMTKSPATFFAWDLLQLEGRDTRDLPRHERRKLLEEMLSEGANWHVSSEHEGDGAALLAAAAGQGLPALFASKSDAPYKPGRSKDWLRIAAATPARAKRNDPD